MNIFQTAAFAYTEDCSGWRFESQHRTDWSSARSYCSYLEGKLWRPTSDIWSCASSLIRRIDNGYIWTGAHRYSESSSWEWTDGSSVSGTRWWPGEPNDAGNEDCVIASDSSDSSKSGWNDEMCSDNFIFVCEWPICGGRTIQNRACNERESYDKITFRDKSTRNSGDGKCTSPGTCKYCKDGFYASGGYCKTKK
ncbi:C-type lectin domain family 19 member A-like [Mytilus galloprovincialis]|uniref:C-type lectin domain family 19 member A-like n=1 Tax=Mytilus galloprovincialis TaxID=29158 RepID=UPI003F7C9696